MLNRNPAARFRLACLALVSFAGLALACKYSVRDVGFVDLEEQQYGLYLYLSKAAEPTKVRDARTIATATFLESNLSLQVAHLGQEPEHPSLWMAEDLGIKNFPAALMRSPEGESLRIPLPGVADKPITEDALWELMESTVSSPKREWLLSRVLDAFAVIVLLESTDPEQNNAAQTAVEGAIESIQELMPKMPKPVDTPPAVLTISSAERDRESILLWSLGFDLDLTDEPQAAILIGRGRRLGPPLQGGLITRTKLQQMMALIGQDCECDLDRSWMQGPMVPLRWDSDQQKKAYDKLAFDPENPLVKAEISRILARGPNARGEVATRSDQTMDTLFLGYSEEQVDPVNVEPTPALEPDPVPEESPTTTADSNEMAAEFASSQTEETSPEAALTENTASNESKTGTPFPIPIATILALGLIALIGGGFIIVRGQGV